MAVFTAPTLVSATNSTLISAVHAVGTVANVATSSLNATAQVVDMAAIKIDVLHAGVKSAAVIDRIDQDEAVAQERALKQVKKLEEEAKLIGNTAFNKAQEYSKLKEKYLAALKASNS